MGTGLSLGKEAQPQKFRSQEANTSEILTWDPPERSHRRFSQSVTHQMWGMDFLGSSLGGLHSVLAEVGQRGKGRGTPLSFERSD
jgi:hypothetical protein